MVHFQLNGPLPICSPKLKNPMFFYFCPTIPFSFNPYHIQSICYLQCHLVSGITRGHSSMSTLLLLFIHTSIFCALFAILKGYLHIKQICFMQLFDSAYWKNVLIITSNLFKSIKQWLAKFLFGESCVTNCLRFIWQSEVILRKKREIFGRFCMKMLCVCLVQRCE